MTREDDTRAALYHLQRTQNGGYYRKQDIHGTASCYRAGCRCTECRAGSARERRTARQRQRDHNTPDQPVAQDGRGRIAWRRGDNHIIPLYDPAEWTQHAACRNTPTHDYYPDKGSTDRIPYIRARDRCTTCPVVDDCLLYALRNKERFGLWGGIPERQRRPLEHMTADDAIIAGQIIRNRWKPRRR